MINMFSDPPVENRARPFWFFNGDMQRPEIERQILEMKNKGLGGFFICARQGLRVPYLSREWFDLCRFAVDTARENGLEVWLYDEYPYPSGMSGGEVTIRHPEATQKTLVFTDEVGAGDFCISLGKVNVLSAMAYPANDCMTDWQSGVDISGHIGILQTEQIYRRTTLPNSVHNHKRYFSYGPSKELRWKSPDGTWRVIIACELEFGDFKYYGNYIDPAHPAAVQCFIDTTYEAYKDALGGDFGKTVKGMFGDETGFYSEYPWSGVLPAYYEERFGERLEPELAALPDYSYPRAGMIRYRYFQCLHELLRDNYHKRLSEWCESNSILYVTEVPSLRMSNQRYSHVPGGDPCHDKLGLPLESAIDRDFLGFRSNSKVISALARQFDRRDSIVESFHSIGWSMTLHDAKWQIDRMSLMGISLHNFHAYFYTLDGITKHDAPPSQFFQNPYWAYYKTFADYCARLSRWITETESSARVAVLHPVTSWWTCMLNPMHRMSCKSGDESERLLGGRLARDYLSVCKSLLFGGVDYDDLDPEVLALGRIENGVIAVGRARYNTVVVPPIKNIESYTLRLLKRFSDSGGNIIFCGMTPYEDIECGFDVKAEFADAFPNPHTHAIDELADAINKLSPPRTVVEIPKELCRQVVLARREDAESDYVLLSSQDGVAANCVVSAAEGKVFVEYDLENGEVCLLSEGNRVEVSLSPWQTRLIAAVEPQTAQGFPTKPPPCTVIPLPLDREWPVSIAGDNVLRLEQLSVSVDGSPFAPTLPNMFVEQLHRCALLKPEHIGFERGFGLPLRPHIKYPAQVKYRIEFHVESIPARIMLMYDRMGIMGEHRICLNGTEVSGFAPRFVYDQNNLAADVAHLVQAGQNLVEIDVTVTEDWHGISDPMYLLGDFGVLSKNGSFVIGDTPEKAIFSAKYAAGFPFHSGEMTFALSVPLPKESAVLTLPEGHVYECLRLNVDGADLGARVFSPYQWEIPADESRPEISGVQLTIAGTLINMLEGSYYDYDKSVTTPISPLDNC
jgi:hypothetical protein